METFITEYSTYLAQDRKVAGNTFQSYLRDVRQFFDYIKSNGYHAKLCDIDNACIKKYIAALEAQGRSVATCKRIVSSLKCYFAFLSQNGYLQINPASEIHTSVPEKKLPEILTNDEVERLLEQPDLSTMKGCRDKAILELLYATGIKVSEVVAANADDIDLENSVLRCRNGKKERMIPLYPKVVTALANYVNLYIGEAEEDEFGLPFFVNMNAKRLTRQGIWKIIKFYAESAGVSKDITPQTLRHSFAAHLMENGARLKDVQKMLGHSDISSTQIYLRLADNHFREVCLNCHPRAREGN